MSISPGRRLTAAAFLLAIVFVACGGAASGSPSGSLAGSASRTPGETAPGATASGSAAASFDLSAIQDAIKNVSTLDSYQADISGTNLSSEIPSLKGMAVVVRKGDPSESELVYAGDTLKFGVIYITSQGTGWVNSGQGWKKVPLPAAQTSLAAFTLLDPGVLLGLFLTDKTRPYLRLAGSETKNGQATVHLSLDASAVPAEASFPPDGKADLWVSADGKYLVAMTFSGTEAGVEKTFDYELTHINDASLKVNPPS